MGRQELAIGVAGRSQQLLGRQAMQAGKHVAQGFALRILGNLLLVIHLLQELSPLRPDFVGKFRAKLAGGRR
ncbi:hypothetical protein D3C71_1829610 [compost metagenome]